jgi:hypothetical protein
MGTGLERMIKGMFRKTSTIERRSIRDSITQLQGYMDAPLKEETLDWAMNILDALGVKELNREQFTSLVNTLEKAESEEDLENSFMNSTFGLVKREAEERFEDIPMQGNKSMNMSSVIVSHPPSVSFNLNNLEKQSEYADEFRSILSGELREEVLNLQNRFIGGKEDPPKESLNIFGGKISDLSQKSEACKEQADSSSFIKKSTREEVDRILRKIEAMKSVNRAGTEDPRDECFADRRTAGPAERGRGEARDGIARMGEYENTFNKSIREALSELEERYLKRSKARAEKERGGEIEKEAEREKEAEGEEAERKREKEVEMAKGLVEERKRIAEEIRAEMGKAVEPNKSRGSVCLNMALLVLLAGILVSLVRRSGSETPY